MNIHFCELNELKLLKNTFLMHNPYHKTKGIDFPRRTSTSNDFSPEGKLSF